MGGVGVETEIRGFLVSCSLGDSDRRIRVDAVFDGGSAPKPPGLDGGSAPKPPGLEVAALGRAAVAQQIAFVLEACRFSSMEVAAQALAKLLLAAPAPGESRVGPAALRLTLSEAGGPSLTVEHDAAWAQSGVARELKPWGAVDTVDESADAGIYRLNLAPGAGIPLHVHRVMREEEMVLSDGLLCQGRGAPAGSVRRWPHQVPHRYDNPTDRWQSILCVNAPRFQPGDEIEVDP